MVAYLNDARYWLQWKVEKVYVGCQGYNIFLKPAHNYIHDFIWDWSRKGGFSLEYDYSVTQSPPGYYSYDKWCYSGPNFRAKPYKDGSGNSRVGPKGANPVFPYFPLLGGLQIYPLLGYTYLTVLC